MINRYSDAEKRTFSKLQKIKFKHCDFAGIVFYPRFLEMLNDLVEDWFEEVLEYSFLKMHPNNGVPTVDLKVQFKSPAYLGDTITKTLWVEELSSKSVSYGFNFSNKDKTVLEGTAVLVNVGFDKKRKKINSENWNETVKSKMKLYHI